MIDFKVEYKKAMELRKDKIEKEITSLNEEVKKAVDWVNKANATILQKQGALQEVISTIEVLDKKEEKKPKKEGVDKTTFQE